MAFFRFHHFSIRNKLAALVVFSLLLVAALITAFFVGQELYSFRSSTVTDLTGLARVLSINCTAPLEFTDSETASEVLSSLSARPQIHQAAVYTRDKKLFARYLSSSTSEGHLLPELFPFDIKGQGEEAYFFRDDHLDLYVPVQMDGRIFGTLLLRADLGVFTEKLTRTVYIVGCIMAASLFLAWIASSILQRYISGPILAMAEVMHRVRNEKKYSIRIKNDSKDELGTLADGFNSMLDHIQIRDRQLLDAKMVAEEANQAKSTFLAQMSHEIRTPMNGVLGIASLLQTTELDNKQTQFVQTIRRSGEALLNVINDILDFSKIEAGKLELEEIPFNLRNSAQEAVELLSEQASQKGLILSCKVDPEIPHYVTGDPGRLRQVLMNLLGNAVKFTTDGEVNLTIGLESRGDEKIHLHFEVADTGIGIPQNKLETIFSAFSQADNSTTREFGGTGLGLVISKQLVQLQGGKIGVDSATGNGSTFWFTIVYKIAEESPLSLSGQSHYKGAGLEQDNLLLFNGHVLVAEDNQTNQIVTKGMLENLGCRVDLAENGSEAIEAVQRHTYDMVFMDCHMPLMDGYKATEIIRKKDTKVGNKRIPVIALTAHAMKGDRDLCIAAGMDDYLSKPCTEKQLRQILEKWLPDGVVKVSSGLTENANYPPALEDGYLPTPPQENPDQREQHFDMEILVVDDNEINQQVAMELLQSFGCRVSSASNGKEAIDELSAQSYDLVFMDCQMPVMDGYQATEIIRKKGTNFDNKRIPIVALTAHAMKGDRDLCIAAGMDDYLSKPCTESQLRQILEKWLPDRIGKVPAGLTDDANYPPAPEDEFLPPPPQTKPDQGEQRFDMEVLVVDDNEINQQVAIELLQSFGCRVSSASNGREAIDEITAKSYDLVFMDCQMPIMDGYQATTSIRNLESSNTSLSRVPIIAITGNVQHGDKEKCLAAGMDGHIIKPYDLDKMYEILLHWSKVSSSILTKEDAEGGAPVDNSVIETLKSLQMAGKPDILSQVINAYLKGSAPLLTELRAALSSSEVERVQNAAHSLKSSSANVGALPLAQLCKNLELDCKQNTFDTAADLVSAIESEFIRVKDELLKHIPQTVVDG